MGLFTLGAYRIRGRGVVVASALFFLPLFLIHKVRGRGIPGTSPREVFSEVLLP
jgi:hypothetical protein